jgi:hypothetical protein
MRGRSILAASWGKRSRGAAKSCGSGWNADAQARLPTPRRHSTHSTWLCAFRWRVGGTSHACLPTVARFAPIPFRTANSSTCEPPRNLWQSIGELFGPVCATRISERPGKGLRQTEIENSTKRRVYSNTPRVDLSNSRTQFLSLLTDATRFRSTTQVKVKCNGYRPEIPNR